MDYYMNLEMISEFEKSLRADEKSNATINKYLRDLRGFFDFLDSHGHVTKEIVIAYKQKLQGNYAVSSVNSMLAAINLFFKKMEWYDCIVKSLKVQRKAFRSENRELTKDEYYRLLRAARHKGCQRIYLVMQTICSTGIRVSELQFITVESVHAKRALVSLKGKTRVVILSAELCRALKRYIKESNIQEGSVFITRNGRPLDRSNILHEMKALCEEAGVQREKVFPHNLRHLFAITYYRLEKDLTHLADLLGHSNVNTTRIYTLTSGEDQEKQINLLGLVV